MRIRTHLHVLPEAMTSMYPEPITADRRHHKVGLDYYHRGRRAVGSSLLSVVVARPANVPPNAVGGKDIDDTSASDYGASSDERLH